LAGATVHAIHQFQFVEFDFVNT